MLVVMDIVWTLWTIHSEASCSSSESSLSSSPSSLLPLIVLYLFSIDSPITIDSLGAVETAGSWLSYPSSPYGPESYPKNFRGTVSSIESLFFKLNVVSPKVSVLYVTWTCDQSLSRNELMAGSYLWCEKSIILLTTNFTLSSFRIRYIFY